jgi:competence protein ComEA
MKRSTLSLTLVALGIAVPLVAFAAQSTSGTTTTPPASTAPKTTSKSTTHHSAPKVDLNTATPEQLMGLPGIDQTTADKIVAARPFKTSKQLYESKIITKNEYKAIESKVTVKAPKSTSSSSTKSTSSTTTK